MAIGALICGVLSTVILLGLFLLYIILKVLAKTLPGRKRKDLRTVRKGTFDGEVIDAEFEEK